MGREHVEGGDGGGGEGDGGGGGGGGGGVVCWRRCGRRTADVGNNCVGAA